jgi:hypothetical protein
MNQETLMTDEMHPDTAAALASGRELVYATDEMLERIDNIRARRPSADSRVIPEVDGMGRLTDLYIASGTIAAAANREELTAEIMGAIQESTLDAGRQHKIVTQTAALPDIPSRTEENHSS